MHLAAKSGNLNMVILLLSRGADVNIRDIYGNNAGYYAKSYNHNEICEYLTNPEFITPEKLVEYKEVVYDKRFDINADDIKKIRGQIAKDLKAIQNKNKKK